MKIRLSAVKKEIIILQGFQSPQQSICYKQQVVSRLFILALLSGCSGSKTPSLSSSNTTTVYHRETNHAENAPLASINNRTNKLHYGLYSNQGQNNSVNKIPDFSYAGYMKGGVALPVIQTVITLEPDGSGDDQRRIQNAINTVANLTLDANGYRGAVLLTAGEYVIDKAIRIVVSGVVLRGEGQGAMGTRIRSIATGYKKLLIVFGSRVLSSLPESAADERRVNITSSYVPVGCTYVCVDSVEGYYVGDRIAIVRTPNDNWLSPDGVDTAQFGWTTSDYRIAHERTVSAVVGNELHFSIPMTDTIEDQYGGGEVYRIDISNRIANSGVENLRLVGNASTPVKGHPTDGPYHGIFVYQTENSWVQNVTFRYLSYGLVVRNEAQFNTFQDLKYIDPRFPVAGGYRYSYLIDRNSGNNLFLRCEADQARHSFVTGQFVPGPNVFLDCHATNAFDDSGPHHRWATGTLFDNTSGYQLRIRNRVSAGSGHGWPGAQQMFWNPHHEEYVLQAPRGAMNWYVGAHGMFQTGAWLPDEPNGIIEFYNQTVVPRSLYLQQLKDRLGPQAVVNANLSDD